MGHMVDVRFALARRKSEERRERGWRFVAALAGRVEVVDFSLMEGEVLRVELPWYEDAESERFRALLLLWA
jgi:hypothetical protein